jgi:hypothetical protein
VPALLLTVPAGHRWSPSFDASEADKDADMSRDSRAKSAREHRDKDKELSSSSSSSARRIGRTPRVPTVVPEEESKSSLLPSGQKSYASGTALISPRRESTGSDTRTDRSSMKGRLMASQSTDDLKEFMSNSTDGAGNSTTGNSTIARRDHSFHAERAIVSVDVRHFSTDTRTIALTHHRTRTHRTRTHTTGIP